MILEVIMENWIGQAATIALNWARPTGGVCLRSATGCGDGISFEDKGPETEEGEAADPVSSLE